MDGAYANGVYKPVGGGGAPRDMTLAQIDEARAQEMRASGIDPGFLVSPPAAKTASTSKNQIINAMRLRQKREMRAAQQAQNGLSTGVPPNLGTGPSEPLSGRAMTLAQLDLLRARQAGLSANVFERPAPQPVAQHAASPAPVPAAPKPVAGAPAQNKFNRTAQRAGTFKMPSNSEFAG